MSKQHIPMYLGVAASILVIFLLNKFLVVDLCTDQGGAFNYQAGTCAYPSGEELKVTPPKSIVALYFILALAVALSVSLALRKLLSLHRD